MRDPALPAAPPCRVRPISRNRRVSRPRHRCACYNGDGIRMPGMRHGANKFFLFAMLLSVLAHVVFASIGQRYISLPAWTATKSDAAEEMTVVLEEPRDTKAPELDPELKLGDAAGTGYASFAAEGVREQFARLADNDQAFLSLDPRGSGPGGE